ncbi:uncharacterized protein F5891DRAFT_958852, partial [Suillus fuscotomentosus]
QCRTGRRFMHDSSESSKYHASFVQTEPTGCSCEMPRQTREHLLRDCPLFICQRIHLHAVSNINILNKTLGMEKEIEAQAKLIHEPDAFKKVAILRHPSG